MKRFKLIIEYDGTPYCGWSKQDDEKTVQGEIEKAVVKFAQEEALVQCAGRTDSGVHATGQVAHIDLEADRSAFQLSEGLNHFLRHEPIVILSAEEVEEEFHARFAATGRKYHYQIINRRAPLALDRDRAWHVPWDLDANAMHEAAQLLIGHHDFTTFRASQCQAKSAEKTLDRLDVVHDGEQIHIYGEARSFLHHQMRNMVGTLERVGSGKWSKEDVTSALEAKDRKAGGPTAPPQGLTLVEVTY